MGENVFILGAGASRDAGAPLMNEFIDVAEDLFLAKQFAEGDHKLIEKIFEAIVELQPVFAKSYLDLINIETLFGAIEMAGVVQKLGKYNIEEIKELKSAMVLLIVKTIEKSIKYQVFERLPEPTNSYKHFVTMMEKESLKPSAIITFNYDIALDYALIRGGKTINYNLEKNGPGEINLLKLHGSTNWVREKVTEHIYPYDLNEAMNEYNFRGDLRSQEVAWELKEFSNGLSQFPEKVLEPLPIIVPPIWSKAQYHNSLTNVWAAAAKALSKAKNIYVFGYSLPESDSFFRYLYALGTMGTSRIRKFHVFDPDDSGKVKERFQALLGAGISQRFEYSKLTFLEAIRHLNPTP